jgi:hypothetical protein
LIKTLLAKKDNKPIQKGLNKALQRLMRHVEACKILNYQTIFNQLHVIMCLRRLEKSDVMFDSINKRRSVRNYQKNVLTKQDKANVLNVLEAVEQKIGPFNHTAQFFFTDNKGEDNQKIGTYGFIKHAPHFIGGVVENTFEGMVDFGFLFEEIILQLTAMNLGTCWLGGTFSRNDYHIDYKADEIIACVSPVGYTASNMSIREKVIRRLSKANNRHPFDELFFLGASLDVVPNGHPYRKHLEAIQVGPSASNKQPWRVIIEEDTFHVYLKRTKGYGQTLQLDIQAIDIGIALSHLHLSLIEDELNHSFKSSKPYDIEDLEYVLSVSI